ncbi:hypothetical protein V6N11_068309 [Hibiscus sabdariffa]|uniref:Uncharacterized protein n=2 Tax=Hibiscus sabdariffa TaxID=183260 RepID=A0ABR1Z7A8_9ROSI
MGASESALSASSPNPADRITTISQRSETVDPALEKLEPLRLEEIEDRIKVADVLAIKLLKKTTSYLSGGRLCKRIAAEGPEPRQSSIKPIAVYTSKWTANQSISSELRGKPMN